MCVRGCVDSEVDSQEGVLASGLSHRRRGCQVGAFVSPRNPPSLANSASHSAACFFVPTVEPLVAARHAIWRVLLNRGESEQI